MHRIATLQTNMDEYKTVYAYRKRKTKVLEETAVSIIFGKTKTQAQSNWITYRTHLVKLIKYFFAFI